MNNNKIIGGICLFDRWYGKKNAGSSRIRGHWLIENWDKVEPRDSVLESFVQGQKYSFIIFQKVYWPQYAKNFDGIKILDICDADFLSGIAQIREAIDNCDAVTTSSLELRDYFRKVTDKPVRWIKDRQDLGFHNKQKGHKGRAKRVCWFGYSHNIGALSSVVPFIKALGLELWVISNVRHLGIEVDENRKWSLETVNDDILKCDIVMVPPDDSPVARFKSNNRTTKAWALGMPVATNKEELKRFLDPIERQKEGEEKRMLVEREFNVLDSVVEVKQLIKDIRENNI